MTESNERHASPDDTLKLDSSEGDDLQTDRAIEAIVRQEGDDELKTQDKLVSEAVLKLSPWARFKKQQRDWWGNPRKRWITIAISGVILVALFSVPLSRYEILGLFIREKVTVNVLDSRTGVPVSGAQVRIGRLQVDTNSVGKAVLYPHIGSRSLQVSKKYYANSKENVLIVLPSTKNSFIVKLPALGRRVSIRVINKITNQPLSDATVMSSGTNTKTTKDGLATIVLPSSANTQPASISLAGYDTAAVTITANGNLNQDTFSITPSGKLYFLSNLSGTLDVVKTNLDGGDRQTVLAGTGQEQANGTVLMVSTDWKYVALLARRSGSNATLYLIDTTNGDKLTTIDSSDAAFSLVGWSGNLLIYRATRNDIPAWQPKRQSLESFNASTGQTLLLDQSQGIGTSTSNFSGQSFDNTYLFGDQLVYTKDWGGTITINSTALSQQAEIDSINADGSGHRIVKTFVPVQQTTNLFINVELAAAGQLLINFSDGTNQYYYSYESGTVITDPSITPTDFYQPYPIYLPSPSGQQLFWSEQRDGKNTLLTGNSSGSNPKQLLTLSDYAAYGWFTDNYLLLSKSNELYIMSINGGNPLKVTDYYNDSSY